MTLVKETGAGLADANTYADVADAEAYLESHLYNDAKWGDATPDEKAAALVMATRSVDVNMEWTGYRVSQTQALDWPRVYVPDKRFTFDHWVRDPLQPVGYYGPTYPNNEVPIRIKEATIELAAELLKADRGAEWDATGVSAVSLGQGAVSVNFVGGAEMLKKIFTPQVAAMLMPFGTPIQNRCQASVHRG